MTTQSEGGGRGGRRGSPSVRISNLSGAPASASSQGGGSVLGAQTGSSSASQQARERYTSVVPASGSSSKVPSRATSALGPTTSGPPSEGGSDDGDTEMRHQTPYPDTFMAEPTSLRLVGKYGAAEQDSEAIAAALLTATVWFQTTQGRPDVFADTTLTSTMRRRIVQLAKAADRHPILHADGSLSQIEAELFNISLPPPPGPPMPALDAEMDPPPPQQRPVDRKGKAPVCTAPRPQPIKPVVAFQRPPPPINLASHPCKSFAAMVRNSKGPVKAAAPVIQPVAAQPAAGPSRPETPRKRRHVPSFTAPGPTRRQVLVSFGKGLAPNLDVARLHNAVNQALTTARAKVAVLSSGPATYSSPLKP